MKVSRFQPSRDTKCLLLGCVLFTLIYLGLTNMKLCIQYTREELTRLHSANNNESLSIPLGFDAEDRSAANNLTQNVRVLCWVMTTPGNHETKAITVNNTWGKRCNKLLFMSSADNRSSLPIVNLGFNESRNILWGKTKKAFQHVYNNFRNDYDWFMKADDDTYVIVENLRYLLSTYDADQDAMYFGSRFKIITKQGYMSGGGGYILSRKSLKLFVEKALNNQSLCKQDDSGAEDAEMGKCLYNVGVMAGDSRDSHSHGKFFPFGPATHLSPGAIGSTMWYWDYIYYPIKNGPECCSSLAISFHYITPQQMYEFEYFIYHLHPFGVHHADPFPALLPPDKKSVPKRLLNLYPSKDENENYTKAGIAR